MRDGILNLLKPAGMTSHDGVGLLRRLTGIKRIGHTGTLDPMAAGVLPICIGSATRIMEYLDLDDKRYRCEMQLGIDTDTQDVWGKTLEQKPFADIDEFALEEALRQLNGRIEQVVPPYSAVKINGKKMYEYARKGLAVPIKKRPVQIKSLELIHFDRKYGRALFDVECSKGTYVRTICKDIGALLGCGAAMSFLVRTASGSFRLEDTITVEELLSFRQGTDHRDPKTGRTVFARIADDVLEPHLLHLDYPLVHFGKALVGANRARWFLNGGYLAAADLLRMEPPVTEGISARAREQAMEREMYNIYYENQSGDELFLGVAVYEQQQQKFLADKVFINSASKEQIPGME